MLEFYKKLVNDLQFQQEDLRLLKEEGTRLLSEYEDDVLNFVNLYEQSGFDNKVFVDKREALAEKSGFSVEFVNLVYLLCACKGLRERYLKKGYTEEMFLSAAMDLKYKTGDCKKKRGMLGIARVHDWHDAIYKMVTIPLGRLQYQKQENWFEKPYTYGAITINPGDEIYYIHIPEAGPLTKELREESYKMAYKYLDKVDGKLYLACNSWLLCEKNPEILGEDNNTVSFMRDFDVYDGFVREADDNMWRIFGYDYDGKPENLPRDTKMQQKIADWYIKGGHLGIGRGFIILDENGRWNK